jgi:hypothetical protein
MREHEMRERIHRFMQTRLGRLVAPATLGLGLAIGGCSSDGLADDNDASKKDSAAVNSDAASPSKDSGSSSQDGPIVAKYMAPTWDAGPDVGDPAPAYMAPMRYAAPMIDPTTDPLPSSRS